MVTQTEAIKIYNTMKNSDLEAKKIYDEILMMQYNENVHFPMFLSALISNLARLNIWQGTH